MSENVNVRSFLTALDALKQLYTCGMCSQLCTDPVTLSKCFHIICAEHFKDLKNCPVCDKSLEDCTIFSDSKLGSCIDAARKIDVMFEKYRSKSRAGSIENRDREKDDSGAPGSKSMSSVKTKQKVKDIITIKTSPSEGLNTSIKINKAAEKKNLKGETTLHIACRLGFIDKVAELLQQGANTNTKDNAGWTPLHEVVQNGRLDLVKLLLQFNTLIDVPGNGNETPLHEAVRYKHKDIAMELVKNGANIYSRNCKGETPLGLASLELKDLLLSVDVLQTQSVNISHISKLHSELDFNEIHVYCISQLSTVNSKLKVLSKNHHNIHIEAKFTKKVTHLIVDADDDGICVTNIDILQGIVNCTWILTSQWVIKSTNDNLEPFEPYEVKGVGNKSYNGPRNARYNKYRQLPGILNGCHFYLHNFHSRHEITKTLLVTKAILTKLINDAGGVVLRRVPNPESIPEDEKLVPYHAKHRGKLQDCSHYIIYKDAYMPMYNMQHLKALPLGWLIECFEKYELCEPW